MGMRAPVASERLARAFEAICEMDFARSLVGDLETMVFRGGKRIPFFVAKGIIYKEGQRLTSSE